MPSLDDSYGSMVAALERASGDVNRSRDAMSLFELVIGALLSRDLDRARRERTISALADSGLILPEALARSSQAEILDSIRDAGLSLPARLIPPLQRLARWFLTRQQELEESTGQEITPTSQLRGELAAISGIGPATADMILLMALRRAVYPLDRATYRIMLRHGWIDVTADYDEASDLLVRQAGKDPDALARLSLWLVNIGRQYCKVAAPRCERCPLRVILPEGGPKGADE